MSFGFETFKNNGNLSFSTDNSSLFFILQRTDSTNLNYFDIPFEDVFYRVPTIFTNINYSNINGTASSFGYSSYITSYEVLFDEEVVRVYTVNQPAASNGFPPATTFPSLSTSVYVA